MVLASWAICPGEYHPVPLPAGSIDHTPGPRSMKVVLNPCVMHEPKHTLGLVPLDAGYPLPATQVLAFTSASRRRLRRVQPRLPPDRPQNDSSRQCRVTRWSATLRSRLAPQN